MTDCCSQDIAGTASAHRKAEEGDLRRQKTDAGEERAERKQCEEDEAGRRRRQQLLNARYQHDVHRDQDGNPVQRLGPDQPPPGLLAVDLRPLVDDADDADGKRQKLPIANERLVRSVGVGDARDRRAPARQCREVAATENVSSPNASPERLRSIVSFGFNLAHGAPNCDCPLLNVWLGACRQGNPRRRI